MLRITAGKFLPKWRPMNLGKLFFVPRNATLNKTEVVKGSRPELLERVWKFFRKDSPLILNLWGLQITIGAKAFTHPKDLIRDLHAPDFVETTAKNRTSEQVAIYFDDRIKVIRTSLPHPNYGILEQTLFPSDQCLELKTKAIDLNALEYIDRIQALGHEIDSLQKYMLKRLFVQRICGIDRDSKMEIFYRLSLKDLLEGPEEILRNKLKDKCNEAEAYLAIETSRKTFSVENEFKKARNSANSPLHSIQKLGQLAQNYFRPS